MKEYSNKIIFMLQDGLLPSDNMRGKEIIDTLENKNIIFITQFLNSSNSVKETLYDEIKEYKNSLFIWIKKIQLDIIKRLNYCNKHVYDTVDNYIYTKDFITNILNLNLVNGLIVNNRFMLNHIFSDTKFNGLIDIVYHHWDPIFKTAILNNQDKLVFGYMGSLPSLDHTDNFLYYKELIKLFQIELLNTEDAKYYTNSIKNNEKVLSSKQKDLKNININFNCHISIRKIDSEVSKFKTTAKIATASVFNHNIITTNEECVKDLLTNEYPFILKKDDIESVKNMFELVIKDYNSTKILWNKGLDIMKRVKDRLNLDTIKNDYIKMISRYIEY